MVVGGISVHNHDSLGLLVKNGTTYAGDSVQVSGRQVSGAGINGPVGAGPKGYSCLPIVLNEIKTDLRCIKTIVSAAQSILTVDLCEKRRCTVSDYDRGVTRTIKYGLTVPDPARIEYFEIHLQMSRIFLANV